MSKLVARFPSLPLPCTMARFRRVFSPKFDGAHETVGEQKMLPFDSVPSWRMAVTTISQLHGPQPSYLGAGLCPVSLPTMQGFAIAFLLCRSLWRIET